MERGKEMERKFTRPQKTGPKKLAVMILLGTFQSVIIWLPNQDSDESGNDNNKASLDPIA